MHRPSLLFFVTLLFIGYSGLCFGAPKSFLCPVQGNHTTLPQWITQTEDQNFTVLFCLHSSLFGNITIENITSDYDSETDTSFINVTYTGTLFTLNPTRFEIGSWNTSSSEWNRIGKPISLSNWDYSFSGDQQNSSITFNVNDSPNATTIELVNHQPEDKKSNVKQDIKIQNLQVLADQPSIALVFLFQSDTKAATLSLDEYTAKLNISDQEAWFSFNTAKEANVKPLDGSSSKSNSVTLFITGKSQLYVIYNSFNGTLDHDPIYGNGEVPSGGWPWWAWVLIALGAVVVVVGVIACIMYVIRGKKKADYERIE